MSNPYAPPPFDPKNFQDAPAPVYGAPPGAAYGMVSQVRIVSILNAVQGFLEIPMGLFTMSMSLLFPTMMRLDPNFKNQKDAPPEFLIWIMAAVYIAMGAPVFIGGVVRIVAAYQNYQYKARTLGFVSFILGMSSVLSCYCAPTAIGVLVYGLIIYLNPAVTAAFQMSRQGKSGNEILASFIPYAPQKYGP